MSAGVVFGYGSLIFRPDLQFVRAEWVRLCGWKRRFYQGSTDHRGVPGAPGRVVTLLPAPEEACWGVAYHLASDVYAAMLERLDRREVGGYARHVVELQKLDGGVLSGAITYVATPDNPGYLGKAPWSAMATQVLQAVGPSGRNRDYVYDLAARLRERQLVDAHVFRLEQEVRALESQRG